MPGCAPLAPGAVSLTQRICDALLASGLARDVVTLLERVEPVPKFACAAPVERPLAEQHFATMAVTPILLAPIRVAK